MAQSSGRHRIRASKNPVLRILKILLIIVIILAAAFAVLLLVLTLTEYKPAERETLRVQGSADASVRTGEELTVMTWNIGYGALGDNADFFMDGGTHVKTASKERVGENLDGITDELNSVDPDYLFLQEVDRDADRSHHIDEVERVGGLLDESAYACNYRSLFVPYPIPPIGRVDAGLVTSSARDLESAERIALPCPFSWPVRLGNLKRCLLVTRTPVTDAAGNDTGQELVCVNLHLEAYDSGEGKEKQTKVLREFLQTEYDKGNYVIAGGDFNQSFSGTDTSMYPELDGMWHCGTLDEEEFSGDWQFLADSTVPTCRSLDRPYESADKDNFQYYMIDGFIVSSNITVESCATQDLQFENTDHNPVVLRARLDGE